MLSKRSLLIFFTIIGCAFSQLVIENSENSVKLTSHIAESTYHLTVKNIGSQSLSSLKWTIFNCCQTKLIFLRAEGLYEKYTDISVKNDGVNQNYTNYQFLFKNPLQPNQKLSIKITENYFGRMKPLPKKITLAEDQNVMYTDNALLYSEYDVLKHKVTYQTPSPPMLGFFNLAPQLKLLIILKSKLHP